MADIIVTTANKRITAMRTYMFGLLDTLLNDTDYKVNAYFLDSDVNNYSIDRIPVEPILENWIIPIKKYREVYELRSRNTYGQDEMENLKNVGFFEELENLIYSNNEQGILPIIDGIEEIECLNCGALNSTDTNACEFSLQIQITYVKELVVESTSL